MVSKINSRLLMIMGCDERDVCPWCDCQGERLHYSFPECTGEFGVEEQRPRIPVIWTVRKNSVLSNRPQQWLKNFIFEANHSRTTKPHRWSKQRGKTMKSAAHFSFFFKHWTDEGYVLPMSALTAVPQKSWMKATLLFAVSHCFFQNTHFCVCVKILQV